MANGYQYIEWNDCVPTLHTDRLLMRVCGPEDAPAVQRFLAQQRDHFAPWFPQGSLSPSLDELISSIQDRLESAKQDRGYRFHLFLRDEPTVVVGQCSIADIRRGVIQQAVLGYGLGHQYQGRGLMTEAARAAVRCAFVDLDLHRLEGSYMPENVKSAAILEELGFKQEGFFKEYLLLNGRWQDHVVTALINPDWQGIGRSLP